MERLPRPAGTGKECRHCKFFDTMKNVVQGTEFSLCRRNAPTSVGQIVGMQPTGVGPDGKPNPPQPMWSYSTLWPAVAPTDWCGEWMRRMEEVPK
jgi:hypothetical protein